VVVTALRAKPATSGGATCIHVPVKSGRFCALRSAPTTNTSVRPSRQAAPYNRLFIGRASIAIRRQPIDSVRVRLDTALADFDRRRRFVEPDCEFAIGTQRFRMSRGALAAVGRRRLHSG
jgi:hypothetical protein